MADRVWIVYDGRAQGGAGTDDAHVLVTCDSDREARSYSSDWGAVACYSYSLVTVGGSTEADDERWEWDWTPGVGYRSGRGSGP